MHSNKHFSRSILVVAAVVVSLSVGMFAPANAATAKTPMAKTADKPAAKDISGALSQSYNADKTVQIGMIVRLKDKDTTTVLAVSNKDIKQTFGVVIPFGKAPIVLSPQVAKQQQVLVATSGRQIMLVSNQNGPIKAGDYVAVSAIDGVAMKAGQEQPQITGKAAGAFTGTSNVAGTVKLKDSLGHEAAIAIGRIPVDVDISHNPLFQTASDAVPGFLSGIALSVASKPVSVARIYLCAVLLFVTAIVSGVVLYSGVRGGMIAIGRNPLSKKSIIKSLIQTVIAGLIIFVVGVLAVYLLLKL